MTPDPVVMQPLPGAGLAGAAKVGAVRNLGSAKRSSESRRSLALASRNVRAGRFYFRSTVFRIDVWSCTK
jgi:hypothetical protein